MKITPLFDRVLLKPFSVSQKKIGNLVIPDALESKPEIAEVIAIGTGGIIDGNKVEFIINSGDKVLYNKYAISEFNINNETYMLIKQTDILGKINLGE